MNLKLQLIILIFFITLLVNTRVVTGATKDSLLQQGITANKAYESADAIKLLDRALQQKPNLVDAYLELGEAKINLGRYPEAIKDYDRALQYNPNLVEAYINRGKAKQFSKSIASSNESLRLDSKNYSSLSIRGQSFYHLKNYSAALNDFNAAIITEPKLSSLYWWRGCTYYMIENYQQAISEYDRAIELSPSSAYLYEYRGNAKLRLFQSVAALTDYQKAVQLAHKDGNLKLVKILNNSIDDIQTQPQRIVIGSIMALFLTGSGFAGLLAISRHNESVYLRQFRN